MDRRLAVLGTALLVVLAGCNAPLSEERRTPTETDVAETPPTTIPATPEPRRDVSNRTPYPATPTPRPADVVVREDLPVDANRTFARVRQLLDARTEPPTVEVYSGPTTGGTISAFGQDAFENVLGIGPPRPVDDSTLQVGGLTMPTGTVYLVPRAGRSAEIERTLAHEFTHTVQFSQDARWEISRALPADRRDTADGTLVERSVLEGAAVYTASEYARRYQPRFPTEKTQIDRLYGNASAGTKLYWAAYHHGAEYVRSRADAPSDLTSVYRSPPATTEQLLHGNGDDPARLRVYAADGESKWYVDTRDSRGELFVRVALGTELPATTARQAATGWGNDEVLVFDGGAGRNFVWVTRWDDAANASEFAAAADRFLDGHASPDGEHWDNDLGTYELDRIGDRTVVLLAGTDRFVTETVVREERTRVYVEPPARDR